MEITPLISQGNREQSDREQEAALVDTTTFVNALLETASLMEVVTRSGIER